MPNHITNIIEITTAEDFAEIKAFMASDYSAFDFEKISPVPPHVWRGNVGQREEKLFGKDTALDWCRANWGTKWNAYEIEVNEETREFRFMTAWTGVPKLVALLSHKLNVPMDYRYYEEFQELDTAPLGYLRTVMETYGKESYISIDSMS